MLRRVFAGLVMGLAVVVTANDVHAGGFEFPAPGTRSLGRGGAFYARADDPMALLYNPANLAGNTGMQLMLNAHVAWYDACYTRAGMYDADTIGYFTRFDADPMAPAPGDWALDGAGFRGFDRVCNEGPPGIIPELAFSWRVTPQLGMGFGFVAPAAVGNTQWGNEEGIISVAGTERPAPTRYMLVKQDNIIVFPTVGVAYSPFPELRIGGAFMWGVGIFDFTTYTVPLPGEAPHRDVRSRLEVSDVFMPGLVASVHVIPIDQLDLMVGARLMDTVHASGKTTLQHGVFGIGQEGVPVQSTVENTLVIDGSELDAPQPWQFVFGARYAQRIKPRPENPAQVEELSGRVEDPMANEWWDVELNVVYEQNSRLEAFELSIPMASFQLTETDPMGNLVGPPLTPPQRLRVPHEWNDQLSIRLGGDFNAVPGLASLRAGVSFETRGVEPAFANLDFMPAQRFGVHGGLTVRIGRFDISLAYAHIFQETLEVSMAEAQLPKIEADSPAPGEEGDPINAGTYEANFDVLSVGVNWHI